MSNRLAFAATFFLAAQPLMAGELKTLSNGVQVIQSGDKVYYTGLKPRAKAYKGLGQTHVTLSDCENLPDEFDLRDLRVVGPTRDQGQCGSCWAFSMTGSLESANAAATGRVLDLSEQQIVSCDTSNYGCNGGFLNDFSFQINNGQALETAFPYTATDSACRTGLRPAARGRSFVNVAGSAGSAYETQVKCALFKSHTIPWITVSANDAWGAMPSGDNAVYTSCGSGEVNHAVGVVGWKKVNGVNYFKMRNSWGNDWGSTAGRPGSERGFAMLKLGCDSFGDEVAYIVNNTLACEPPMVKLPVETITLAQESLDLAVKGEAGVAYEWFQGDEKIGDGPSAFIAPGQGGVYRVVATNACGAAESATRVVVR